MLLESTTDLLQIDLIQFPKREIHIFLSAQTTVRNLAALILVNLIYSFVKHLILVKEKLRSMTKAREGLRRLQFTRTSQLPTVHNTSTKSISHNS